jgi:hypothetical protein
VERGSDDEQRVERGKELATAGAEMLGAGVGGTLGAIGGPPGIVAGAVGGVLVTRLFKWGTEVAVRLLSQREKARVGAALAVAAVRVQEREEAGEQPRTDGFFEPRVDRLSDAEEALEGTLLNAARSWEERKLQYLGRLYASLGFDASVSAAYANFLIGLIDRLRYRQLVALAFIGNEDREQQRVLLGSDLAGAGVRSAPSIVAELGELGTLGLIGVRQNDESTTAPADTYGGSRIDWSTIGQIGLTEAGRDLLRLAELREIPSGDQDEIAAALRGERG